MTRLAGLIVLFFGIAGMTVAQSPSDIPKTQMKTLAPLLGIYETVTEFSPDGGTTWQAGPAKKIEISLRQKGLMMAEVPLDTSGPGFHMENYLTFDQYRKVYRKAAIDDTWGVMDIYEGSFKDGQLTLTNLKSRTTFPTETGERFFKLMIEVKSGPRWMYIHASEDGGKSWQPSFRVSYTPVTRD